MAPSSGAQGESLGVYIYESKTVSEREREEVRDASVWDTHVFTGKLDAAEVGISCGGVTLGRGT